MPLRGALKGTIFGRGVAGGGSVDVAAPDAPPSISAFAFSDMTIDEDVAGTFTATIGGGTLTGWSLDPDDGSAPYTGSGASISQAHTYVDPGTYNAVLTATGPGGVDTETIIGIVVSPVVVAAPDVRVLGNGNVISDGDATPSSPDHTIFITAVESAGGTTRTFTVENTGTATLTTSGLTVPTGYTVTEGLPASISAGASDTFTVRLDDTTAGVKSGSISFTTNVAGKNPYNFAITGEVVVAGAETLMFTETRRNQTASTVNKAPVSFVVAFDIGAVPSSDTLVLRDSSDTLIPTTHWQWNERSSYSDGSLRSCVISCLSPSMAANATAQWKVYKTPGARPNETNTRTTADISNVYDFNVRLTNAVTVRSSGTAYEVRGSGTFRCDVNAGLASNVTVKEFAGPVRTKWYTWRKFIDEGTSAVDAYLWAEFEVDEWIDPDTGNPVNVLLAPRLRNGWARSGTSTWPAIYQCQIRNGASVLFDYSRSATYETSDVTGGVITNTHSKLPYGKGSVIRFSSGCPGNVTPGQWYNIRTDDTYPTPYTQLTVRSNWDGNSTPVSLSAATTQFTATTGAFHSAPYICEAVNDDGGEHVALGAPLLYPAWTTAEKRARMDAGLFMPVNLQVQVRDPANVSEFNIHTLGGSSYHRRAFDDTGGGLHIGDSTFWMADCLRSSDMTPFRVRRCRITAAEAAQPGPYGYLTSDDINPATGVEYACVIPANNGPDGAGASYSGLPPPRPTASTHPNLLGNPGTHCLPVGWIYSGPSPGFSDSGDGTHTTAAHHHDWAMFGTTRYLKLSLLIHGKCTTLWPATEASEGSTRTVNGRTYYRIHAVGVTAWSNARANGQISHHLSQGAYLADWRPERAYVDDLVDDNFAYMLDSLAAGSLRDEVTKRFGWLTPYTHGGTDQHWFNARGQHGCLSLLKRSGWGTTGQRTSIIEWATNYSLIHGRASRSGVNVGYSKKAWQYACATFDHVFWADDSGDGIGNDVRGIPKGQSTEADMGVLASAITFNADNTITLTLPGDGAGAGNPSYPAASVDNAWPENGDVFVYPNRYVYPSWYNSVVYPTAPHSQPPPAGIAIKTKYWIYDVTGSGFTRTAKVSSTPGPSYTQVTWTGSTTGLTFVVWTVLSGDPKGPYWNPAFKINSQGIGYSAQVAMPAACAYRWFGKADCLSAYQSFLQNMVIEIQGGYAGNLDRSPQNFADTQIICDV